MITRLCLLHLQIHHNTLKHHYTIGSFEDRCKQVCYLFQKMIGQSLNLFERRITYPGEYYSKIYIAEVACTLQQVISQGTLVDKQLHISVVMGDIQHCLSHWILSDEKLFSNLSIPTRWTLKNVYNIVRNTNGLTGKCI